MFRLSELLPKRKGDIVALVRTATNRAAIRSTGCGFSLNSCSFGGFPSLNISQFPARAAGGQADRFGESRIGPQPTARGQVVDVVSRANLAVCEKGIRHFHLHRVTMGAVKCIDMQNGTDAEHAKKVS
jgi:hypothetical protein